MNETFGKVVYPEHLLKNKNTSWRSCHLVEKTTIRHIQCFFFFLFLSGMNRRFETRGGGNVCWGAWGGEDKDVRGIMSCHVK